MTVMIPFCSQPGIYKLISSEIGGHDADFGEINLLTPGEKVTIIQLIIIHFQQVVGEDRK